MMRKTIFFLCASLLIRSTLLAQELHKVDSVNKSTHLPRFSFGFFYNPSVNTYNVYGDTKYGNRAIIKSHLGNNYGVIGSLRLSKRFSIQSGVGVSDFGYDMFWKGTYAPQGLYRFNVRYIEVPLEIKVTTASSIRRFGLLGSIGGSAAFLNKKEGAVYTNGATQINLTNFDDFDQYAPILSSVNFGCGLIYSYAGKLTIELLPMVKIFVNKNTYSSIPGDNEWTHISSVGVRICVNYKV